MLWFGSSIERVAFTICNLHVATFELDGKVIVAHLNIDPGGVEIMKTCVLGTFRHFVKVSLIILLGSSPGLICISPASALVDFPIGYSSRGGAYAFIALIEQQQLLEQEGIRSTFVYIAGPPNTQALLAGNTKMAFSERLLHCGRQPEAQKSDLLEV